jgi:hypothetical protein
MNQQQLTAHIAERIATLEAAIIRFDARPADADRPERDYIVQVDGVNSTFDFTPEGVFQDVRPAAVHTCKRFLQGDAEFLATQVRNGNGRTGVAVHIRPAMYEALTNLRELYNALIAYE